MKEGDDFVREYARVRAALSDARKAALVACGHTEDSLREVEGRAIEQMAKAEWIETEFGTVQRYSVPYYVHEKTKLAGERIKLKTSRREKK